MNDELAGVERWMRETIEAAERDAASLFGPEDLPLYGLIRYHLGWADTGFRPVAEDPGKRVRPTVCLLCCRACGGDAVWAEPVAAAIELLHNFTLIHDDIQDRGRTRRHRPTVWSLWGEAQAINAGDALFALSHLLLSRATDVGVAAPRVVELMREFNRATLRIVEGQVLDLGYERRWTLSEDDYLRMIGGKTAALVAFAAWAGALAAGADPARRERFQEFGRALGLGFQVRDDMLGIWGEPDLTGKPAADDLRRRKKSLPVIALFHAADDADRRELVNLYASEAVDDAHVERVLGLLERYAIEEQAQAVVQRYHEAARRRLAEAAEPGEARDRLERLLDRLGTRVS